MGPEQTKKNRSTNLKISPNIPYPFLYLIEIRILEKNLI